MGTATTGARLLDARDLVVEFPVKGWRKPPFRALNGVSIDIRPGETLGLVGESGSGKTTLGRAILGLVPIASGGIEFAGRDISHLGARQRRALSTDIQVVFQDPYSSLNPAMTIGEILGEPLSVQPQGRAEAERRVQQLLDAVDLPADAEHRYPREFSGGQRQRVAIARALALDPKLIVCDEPVSALDLSTQSRVLDLLIEIQERTGVSYLFISHDLSVVRAISHRVAVMYRGDIVEIGDGDTITSNPHHAYSKRLLMAAPIADPIMQRDRRAARRRFLDSQMLITQQQEAM
ncbi:peptide/nickel transport system ATP-binding protein [Agromyces sp. 3263]|uniref:ATP-binding cassette domain-containing protein n=1 Tax=Agromyces sp. 3263 TaxID=2817750 RepID=UPI00285E1BDD|nr:ATP-binding cassette domain-containing protein [Agromyces sp. 3263]MDR6906630.1 peptide/nickel transport system ATP-binding protein [Agromyces sp. 3263]